MTETAVCEAIDPVRITQNMQVVSKCGSGGGSIVGRGFQEVLRNLMWPEVPLPDSPEPRIVFYSKTTSYLAKVLEELMGGIPLPEHAEYPHSEWPLLEQKTKAGLEMVRAKFPRHFECFAQLVPFVILARRPGYGGGTVSNRIGFVWLSPELRWADLETGENCFHEFIHNALFLEDMVRPIFSTGSERMAESDGLVLSAIRRVKRGYDKSFHSAFVSFGIVRFYMECGMFGHARRVITPLVLCLEELAGNVKFITANGQDLLDDLIDRTLLTKTTLDSAR